MDQFWIYFKLGFAHILDWNDYSFMLFLTVLVAAYTIYEWKRILWLVTLVNISYVLGQILTEYDIIPIDRGWVEFLIPIVILITACYTILTGGKKIRNQKTNLLFFMAVFFGVHNGLGFSAYFDSVSGTLGNMFLPLLEFGLGMEVAMVLMAMVILILSFFFHAVLRFSKRDWVLVISSMVVGLTIPILCENWLW